MRQYFVKLFLLGLLGLFCAETAHAQAKVVLNGGTINLTNNANLVIQNPATDAIIRHGGSIISEGEKNLVKWYVGQNEGLYQVPWGAGQTGYLPFSFTKSAGAGNGYYLFSTYPVDWGNNTTLPEGVSPLSDSPANADVVLNRFWRMEAVGYTTKPTLSNLTFTYLDGELQNGGNERSSFSGLQGWDKDTQSWTDFQAVGQVEKSANTLSVAALPESGNYTWWGLTNKVTPLPLDFISFTANKAGPAILLNWVTVNEVNCRDFEIQRSQDGVNFTRLASQKALNGSHNTYVYRDGLPLSGTTYYRIKQNDLDGKYTYTAIRSVMHQTGGGVSFYPNPTGERQIMVFWGNNPLGSYTLTLFDSQGRVVQRNESRFDQSQFVLNLPANLQPGVYLIRINNALFTTQSKLVVK